MRYTSTKRTLSEARQLAATLLDDAQMQLSPGVVFELVPFTEHARSLLHDNPDFDPVLAAAISLEVASRLGLLLPEAS